ncbi:hypothetical protein [Liquorilactobacillus hordei]|uniref:Uncharacterized protein n=1 Tax=Liquorilactobacillus hordei DSM 19519 TaxID=1423759 RepID=A0A0R1MFB0_9LACO|nr:hypothetical protein [Liquorilactobacillus hordei]KRL06684.1 hypothetical protein FC92_GL000471 [Liquorilactobacillus hordei DSM 19519]QYH52419.1 hypothetical protein G6O70_08255 [Liquorilactobacillus hordei DSM 19519]
MSEAETLSYWAVLICLLIIYMEPSQKLSFDLAFFGSLSTAVDEKFLLRIIKD